MSPLPPLHPPTRTASPLPLAAGLPICQLDLTMDFGRRTLASAATWHLAGPGALALVLDVRGLHIEAMGLDDTAAARYALSTPDARLGQALRIELGADTRTVTACYRTAPGAAALQWLSPAQTAGRSQPFLFTQSQAILARTRLPCPDSPGPRFTYEATVQVPAGLLALMSAENSRQAAADGRHQFRQPQPSPA